MKFTRWHRLLRMANKQSSDLQYPSSRTYHGMKSFHQANPARKEEDFQIRAMSWGRGKESSVVSGVYGRGLCCARRCSWCQNKAAKREMPLFTKLIHIVDERMFLSLLALIVLEA